MGSGKTTIDIHFAMQQGYQPVIISPWEDNYDKDILQLIYLKLSKIIEVIFLLIFPRLFEQKHLYFGL